MFSLSKRMIRRIAIVFAIATVSAACTTTQVAVAPAAAGLPESATATLHINANNTAASIAVIYDQEGNVVRRASYWTDNLREVTVRPGLYEVVLRVDGTYPELASYPRIVINVQAGERHELPGRA
ncbi:hypothetical protein GJ700_11610 [Duganella sp. FT92W]|uniref:Uncharacterized protein n=1 Tax=Pseudoduganella rivuli TaxID=2666085 RepID=A0A7X2ILR4_9BURK|nr:hypothetical protein [Pseudoduganella rivuli]MRV72357.1 hypothetical protein [Pseudoduganella rivuli]